MSEWKIVLHDVEVARNFFNTTIEDYFTKEQIILEISPRMNQLDEVYKWYNLLHTNKRHVISFNGIHYDNSIVNFILLNYSAWKELEYNNLHITNEIKQFSDRVIKDDQWFKDDALKQYKWYNKWVDIDIFCYWSKQLRINKKISLKSLGIQLNYPVVQELPYHPDDILTNEMIEKVIIYNSVHDLGILRWLVEKPIYLQGKPTSFKEEINIRFKISNDYKINAMSYDSPKIASELLLDSYCKKTGRNKQEVRKERHSEGERLPLQNPNFTLPVFQELYENMSKANRDFSKEINFNCKKTSIKLSYGIGGAHNLFDNKMYETNDTHVVITSDVSSMYPQILINYKLFRQPEVLEIYSNTKAERMIAKKNKDKAKDGIYKLILNSSSGHLDSEHSWLYNGSGAMKMRFMGQLILTKLLEELTLHDFQVISLNTDGAESYIEKSRISEYYSVVESVGRQFDLEFEHDTYSKVVYSNVNSYIAITEKGEVKQKGSIFTVHPNLGDSCNSLIIPKTLEAYFKNGVNVEKFVKSETDIFLFCNSKKVDKSYTIVHGNTNLSQRINRYYVSKHGSYLYKKRKGKLHHMLKGWGTTIYNEHVVKPIEEYDIDYRYYISQINDIIKELQISKYQLSLF